MADRIWVTSGIPSVYPAAGGAERLSATRPVNRGGKGRAWMAGEAWSQAESRLNRHLVKPARRATLARVGPPRRSSFGRSWHERAGLKEDRQARPGEARNRLPAHRQGSPRRRSAQGPSPRSVHLAKSTNTVVAFLVDLVDP